MLDCPFLLKTTHWRLSFRDETTEKRAEDSIEITINMNPHSNPFRLRRRRRLFCVFWYITTYYKNILFHTITRHDTTQRRSESTHVRIDELFIRRFIAYDFDGSATLCDGFIATDFYFSSDFVRFIDWCWRLALACQWAATIEPNQSERTGQMCFTCAHRQVVTRQANHISNILLHRLKTTNRLVSNSRVTG